VRAGGSSGGALMSTTATVPASESVDLPINTASLPNGQHTLKVLQDAAGNSAVVYDGSI